MAVQVIVDIVVCAAGGPAWRHSGPPLDLSPEKVNSLICGWNVDWVFIFVGLCSELRFVLFASGSVVWIGCLRAFV